MRNRITLQAPISYCSEAAVHSHPFWKISENPASRVQRLALASRVHEFRYVQISVGNLLSNVPVKANHISVYQKLTGKIKNQEIYDGPKIFYHISFCLRLLLIKLYLKIIFSKNHSIKRWFEYLLHKYWRYCHTITTLVKEDYVQGQH